MMNEFGGFYRGKRVLVTGHTGFKGSWLALWLTELGAEVIGYSSSVPGELNHFDACRLAEAMHDVRGDVVDYDKLQDVFRRERPEMVFHLAAQPLVREAYSNPRATFESNVMGTVNVLESARKTDSVAQVIVVTSDKVYRNADWEWAYRETDPLGGYEPYGVSKACAELVVGVYQDRRFQHAVASPREFAVASARAGNVIGGGDWAAHRIVPDLVRAIVSKGEMLIRSPHAVRPWQHVLEALSGYLSLGWHLGRDPVRFASNWNFGPYEPECMPVGDLAQMFIDLWPMPRSILRIEENALGEHRALQVDSSKALTHLHWRSAWGIESTLQVTVDWYRAFYESESRRDLASTSRSQIASYCQRARKLNLNWALAD